MVILEHVSRRYGKKTALDDVSAVLKDGEITGLLGVNGAGKSTLLRILAGCLAPSSGRVSVDGFDLIANPREVRRLIGYLPENAPMYAEMTVYDCLRFVCRIHEIPKNEIEDRVRTAAEQTDITSVLHRKTSNLSRGFRQRAALAQALCCDSSFIILDEPTSGLDPLQSALFRDVVSSLRGRKTVLFSTHILSEAEELSDRVLILHHGRLIADRRLGGSAGSLRRLRLGIYSAEESIQSALAGLPSVARAECVRRETDSSVYLLECISPDAEKQIFTLLSARHIPIERLMPSDDSLESIFLKATGDPASM